MRRLSCPKRPQGRTRREHTVDSSDARSRRDPAGCCDGRRERFVPRHAVNDREGWSRILFFEVGLAVLDQPAMAGEPAVDLSDAERQAEINSRSREEVVKGRSSHEATAPHESTAGGGVTVGDDLREPIRIDARPMSSALQEAIHRGQWQPQQERHRRCKTGDPQRKKSVRQIRLEARRCAPVTASSRPVVHCGTQ